MGLLDQLALHAAGLGSRYLQGTLTGQELAYQRQMQEAQRQALEEERQATAAWRRAQAQRLQQPTVTPLPWEKEGLPRAAYPNTAAGHLQYRKDLAEATRAPASGPTPHYVTERGGKVTAFNPVTGQVTETGQVERESPTPMSFVERELWKQAHPGESAQARNIRERAKFGLTEAKAAWDLYQQTLAERGGQPLTVKETLGALKWLGQPHRWDDVLVSGLGAAVATGRGERMASALLNLEAEHMKVVPSRVGGEQIVMARVKSALRNPSLAAGMWQAYEQALQTPQPEPPAVGERPTVMPGAAPKVRVWRRDNPFAPAEEPPE